MKVNRDTDRFEGVVMVILVLVFVLWLVFGAPFP